MKRKGIVTLFITIILGLVLAGQVSAQAKFGPRTDSFMKIFSSGTYHMKAAITGDGDKADMELFSKGGRIATTVTAEGETVRIIIRDSKTYMIMDSMKTIFVYPSQDASMTGAVDIEGQTLTGSGNAPFNGKNLPYEEYTTKDGSKAQYFVDGSKLAGIRNTTPGELAVDIAISALDQNVPDSVFSIPSSGYQVQDMTDFNF